MRDSPYVKSAAFQFTSFFFALQELLASFSIFRYHSKGTELLIFIFGESGEACSFMRLEARGKINWSLDILGVRGDGYHLMDMLMQPVTLSDTITLQPSEDLTLSTAGTPLLKADEMHLAMRAARLLKESTGYPGGAAISVFKRIPVGAGMGGGSADASAVLWGLNRLWGTNLSLPELEKTGLKLGADIPFCLHGGLTRTRGIGEEMENLPCGRYYPLVIIQPCRGLSTAEVFKAYRDAPELHHPETETTVEALAEGNLVPLRRSLDNVLQPFSAAMRPEINKAISRLRETGAEVAQMTGSGSAVFGVYRSSAKARAAMKTISMIWPRTFFCRTCSESIQLISEDE